MGTTKQQPNNNQPENGQQPNNQPNNQPENNKEVELKGRNIVRVTRYENNRYYFEVDGEPFAAYNKNGEAVESNSFSIDLTTIAKQIGTKNEMFNTAFAMASAIGTKGKNATLNPAIVSLCFTNSKVDIKRIHIDANDLRETGVEGDTYGKDTWKTVVTDITPNINAFSQQALIQLIMNPQTLTIKEEPTTPTLATAFANIV